MGTKHGRLSTEAVRDLDQVRAHLTGLCDRQPPVSSDDDPLRRGVHELATQAALHVDELWCADKRTEGPIDLIDMFSGCGGMSTGFAAANALIPSYRLAMAVDIEPDANATYAENLGVQPECLNIAELAENPRALKRAVRRSGRRRGNPLVLIGCAPCQGFSSHRNQERASDTRNNLFVAFAKIAGLLQPDAVVVENVPELLTDRYWDYLVAARQILMRHGYQVHVGVHNMADFGVPQERFRVLLLAMKQPFALPEPILERSAYRTVRWAIERLPRIRPGEIHHSDSMHYTAGHRASTIETIRAVPPDGGSRPAGTGPESLRRIEARQGRAAYEDVYGRLSWDRPSVTVTAYARNPASGRYIHPEQHRGLSVREAALLQGFPSTFSFVGSLDERFRQIGNAVPPPFAAFLAVHIMGELLAEPLSTQPNTGINRPIGSSFSRLIPALKAGHRSLAGLISPSE